MHTMWKGAISFGLVHVPVKMFAATEDKDISLKYIHNECGTPISYVKMCKTCEEEAAWESISRGYEYEPGRYVVFEKEELNALTADVSKEIKILNFVDLNDIDPIYFQKTYYLGPGDTGSNAYSLLLTALKESGKIGIANVTLRSKSSLAAIRVIGDALAMERIYYPDEIRAVEQVPNLPEAPSVDDKELEMAAMLINQLSSEFDPGKYQDEYRAKLQEAIEHKVAGQEIKVAPSPEVPNVIDLMSALQASLNDITDKSGTAKKKPAAKKTTRKKKSEKASTK